ncbi:MAG: hypothetical protein HQL98_00010 [Magnetococcales bacterium]|nr:hypothetical protein [Magnetococcales bacterium]
MLKFIPLKLKISFIAFPTVLFIWSIVEEYKQDFFGMVRWTSLVITILEFGGLFVLNRYWRTLWQYYPTLGYIIFPDLNGIWQGTLRSEWINPETREKPGPIDAEFTIKQNWMSTTVRMRTKESESGSTNCTLDKKNDGRFSIIFNYSNTPQYEVWYRSPKHDGTCTLVYDPTKPNELTGSYYTERSTKGQINLKRG